MNKKKVSLLMLIIAFISIAYAGAKALESISDLDLSDPFEVDFDE